MCLCARQQAQCAIPPYRGGPLQLPSKACPKPSGTSGAIPGLAAGQSPDWPWAGSLSCQALLHPMVFPAGRGAGVPGHPSCSTPAPGSAGGWTRLCHRAQVWPWPRPLKPKFRGQVPKASLAVSSPPLPARCRSDGLDRLRSCASTWKGCGHACRETLRNSAETGKTPSSPRTEPRSGARLCARGARLAAAPCRGPHHPTACPDLLLNWPAVGGWWEREKRGFKGFRECGSYGAGWWWGCSSVARWGQPFLPLPVVPNLLGRGVSSGSLMFAGWVFPSTSWRSHVSLWEGKALHRQRKE